MVSENPIDRLKVLFTRNKEDPDKKLLGGLPSTIVLKSNKVGDFLSAKKIEYQARITSSINQGIRALDATYKILLVNELLTLGEVDVLQILKEEKNKKEFDLTIFKSACSVINDYVQNEGKGLAHGTGIGLPKK